MTQRGLVVLYFRSSQETMDDAYVLSDDRGVIFGRLFDRQYADCGDTLPESPGPVVLDRSRVERIVTSGGRDLIEHYWGQYVAILREPSSGTRRIIRDPTGGIPCQWSQIGGIDIYFVRLQDRQKLGHTNFSVNFHFIIGYLLYSSRCVRETAINEIESLLPGECVEYRLGDDKHRFFIWNPLSVATNDIIENAVDAQRLVRTTVSACVHAWASCFDSILHSLSGGLDSAIVLSCLSSAPTQPKVVCRNLYTPTLNSDERKYARLAAQRAGVQLIEQKIETRFDIELPPNLNLSPYPLVWPIDFHGIQKEGSLIKSLGASVVFDGHGGDELFFCGCSIPGAVDYAWLHGPHPILFLEALNDASLDRVSIWQILRVVYQHGLRKRPWHMRNGVALSHMPLMKSDIKHQAFHDLSHWHPLFKSSEGIPPGKFEHAYLLTLGSGAVYVPDAVGSPVETLSPLRSQPVIELSLRIPLYILRTGGRDRSIARSAFGANVPREIILRRSKAYGNDQFREAFSHNVDFARELLLDGFLVREGLVDKMALEEVLSGHVSRIQAEITELCDYLAIETWIRCLNTRRSSETENFCVG